MALTQSARLPGPSWDEEVVPALRKRLETESRTLAKRMSAVSLASSTNDSLSFPPSHSTFAAFVDIPSSSSTRLQTRTTSPLATAVTTSNREQAHATTAPPPPRPNVKSASRPTNQRSRTYSQPYHTDLPNGKPVNGSSRPRGAGGGYGTSAALASSVSGTNPHGATRPVASSTAYYPDTTTSNSPMLSASTSSSRPPQPRPVDIKPTRIPVASRTFNPATTPNGGSSTSPQVNGYGYNSTSPPSPYFPPTTSPPTTTTYADSRTPTAVYQSPNANASQSTVSVPSRQHSGILNEQPPFEPSMPSPYGSHHGHGDSASSYDYNHDEPPPRPSMDSEEHPFEHWYRGEVSRNGGVGELRVGKRQEMLDIANYGHSFHGTTQPRAKPLPWVVEEGRRKMRKRADSVDGVGTEKERQRGSLYLDEDGAKHLNDLLDESPLTDLEGDGEFSDVASVDYHRFRHRQRQQYQNQHGDGDNSLENGGSGSGYNDTRSTTPTPAAIRPSHHSQHSGSTIQQHGSNGHGGPPPTRIPAPPSRKSSDTARVPTPTQYQTRGSSEPPMPAHSRATTPSSSSRGQAKTPPPPQPSASGTTPSPAAGGKKKSPASSKKNGSKSPHGAKGKTAAMLRKEAEEAEKRRSVAYYPTPDGGEGETMEHAIPVWTQPVRDGNWDDVVLPAVARKKGLEGYAQMDGSPRPLKREDSDPAPAPGTFGFRYRPSRAQDEAEFIPLDEFGQPIEISAHSNGVITEEPEPIPRPMVNTPYDETPLPVHRPPDQKHPTPTEYPPQMATRKPSLHQPGTGEPVGLGLDLERAYEERMKTEVVVEDFKEDDVKGGCCKCVIM